MDVFFAALFERAMLDYAVMSYGRICCHAGMHGFNPLQIPYNATDIARNIYVEAFRNLAKSPDDILIMLDMDHEHPNDVLERLSNHIMGHAEMDVVGCLAFKRSEPHSPCFFVRVDPEGNQIPYPQGGLLQPANYPKGLVRCATVGTGAIAIRRAAFDKLIAAGHKPPFFRYAYADNATLRPSEDMYFGDLCEKTGINHWVDTITVTPHLALTSIVEADWIAPQPEPVKKPALTIAETGRVVGRIPTLQTRISV